MVRCLTPFNNVRYDISLCYSCICFVMSYCIALPARVLFAIKDYYILAVSFSLAKENIIYGIPLSIHSV
jgi:hypothetical protein